MARVGRRFVTDLLLAGAAGVVLFFLFTALVNFSSMAFYAKRAEQPANLDGIWAAERSYELAFDEPVASLPPMPRSPGEADRRAVAGSWDRGWAVLGWKPDGSVRGVYWVSPVPGLDAIVVIAMSDIDGDGVPTWYARSRWGRATRLVEDGDVL